jgi:hypothetical protein
MNKQSSRMSEEMLEQNRELRQAYLAHHDFDEKAARMDKKFTLSGVEDMELKKLKKKKLAMKDKMESIISGQS